nr:PREDICTED: uncharacterized protein LOC109043907 isoform X1 [Bemisia tabaci]
MSNKKPRLIVGGNSIQSSFDLRSNVSSFSEPCSDVSLLEASSYRSLQFPDIRLTRLENDANCLKYLQSSYKEQRYKSLYYNSDSAAPSESEGTCDESSDSEYIFSDEGSSSSDSSIEKVTKVKVSNCKVTVGNCEVPNKASHNGFNSFKVSQLSGTTIDKVSNLFLKLPVVRLVRLENDENCYKYLNHNSRLKMPEETVDKRLNPIVIIPNPNVSGKRKTSFMIKKPVVEGKTPSEESKDSCYDTCINDSDSSLASSSCNQLRRFSVDLNGSTNSWKPLTSPGRKCLVPSKSLASNFEETKVISEKGSEASTIIDLVSEDSSSSIHEVRSRSNRRDSENSCVSSELMSEESCSSEIARCFDQENQNSDENSNSNDLQRQSPATDVLEREVTKTHDSGIGTSDDGVSIMDESFILKPSFVIPHEDSDTDIIDGEECFIVDVQFIPDDVYERLQSQRIHPAEKPIEATCELCNTAFTARPNLYSHMKESHNFDSIYECVHCGQIFNVKACLVYHLYAKLSLDAEMPVDETHLCPQYSCSEGDFQKSELTFLRDFCSNHSMLHSQLLKFEIADQNQKPIPKIDSISGCVTELHSECDKEPPTAKCLNESNHNRPESALRTNCGKKSKLENLKRKSTVKGRISRKKQKNDQNESNYICHLCNENHSNKKGLFNHFENCHNSIYYYECRLCQKLFQNSTSFASHYVRKECVRLKENKNSRCDICDNMYKNRQVMRKHKMNLHNLFIPLELCPFVDFLTKFESSESFVNCIFCYESFSCWDQLVDHERDLHDYFTCFEPFCSAKFFSKSEFEKHLFIHFAPGESSFCEFCSKLFFTKQYLEKHIRDHLTG